MSKKGYVHIAEYDLTKKILDRLDIDIEDDFELSREIGVLMYKDDVLIFPSYDECIKRTFDGVIFRPFTNQNHASYLMNLFGDAKKYDTIFEYKDAENGTHTGILKLHHKKKGNKEITFTGLKSIPVLMMALILKATLTSDVFKSCVGGIYSIDRKVNAPKNESVKV